LYGADEADFGGGDDGPISGNDGGVTLEDDREGAVGAGEQGDAEEEEEGGTIVEYMLTFIKRDPEYFKESGRFT
jgi:helicase SWR1